MTTLRATRWQVLTTLLVANGLIFLFPLAALADAVKVIANPSVSVDAISADELKNIFLEGKSSLPNGDRVEPVLQKGGTAHEAFLREVLHQSDAALQTYYRALIFTGKGFMPKAFRSDVEVVAYVARTRGAIGYVSADAEAQGVKTLSIADSRKPAERRLITRVEPVYPETLFKMQIGGIVRLRATISPKGSVEGVELLGGNPALAEAAMKAVKQWVYAPYHSSTTVQVNLAFDPIPRR